MHAQHFIRYIRQYGELMEIAAQKWKRMTFMQQSRTFCYSVSNLGLNLGNAHCERTVGIQRVVAVSHAETLNVFYQSLA